MKKTGTEIYRDKLMEVGTSMTGNILNDEQIDIIKNENKIIILDLLYKVCYIKVVKVIKQFIYFYI